MMKPFKPTGQAGGVRGTDGNRVSTDARSLLLEAVPPSLTAYLETRVHDAAASLRTLSAELAPAGMWTAVTPAMARRAAMSPCRFDAGLLLREEDGGLAAMIAAETWSVTLRGEEAWIDVDWPSEVLATAMVGRRVKSQIDFPFLSEDLVVQGSETMDGLKRFHCTEIRSWDRPAASAVHACREARADRLTGFSGGS